MLKKWEDGCRSLRKIAQFRLTLFSSVFFCFLWGRKMETRSLSRFLGAPAKCSTSIRLVWALANPSAHPSGTGLTFRNTQCWCDRTSNTVVGAPFPYYVAVSCGGTLDAPAVDKTVAGDNVAKQGVN
jgi:hypothetical protein